jgi:hypothetical protein
VENLVALLNVLKEEGVTILGDMEEYPYGKFGWIVDPKPFLRSLSSHGLAVLCGLSV